MEIKFPEKQLISILIPCQLTIIPACLGLRLQMSTDGNNISMRVRRINV